MRQRIIYDPSVLRLLLQKSEDLVEMAIPSYLHSNPLVRWVVAWRMNIVVAMLDIDNSEKTLLDYGCGVGVLFLQLPPNKNKYYGVDLDIWPAKEVLKSHGMEGVILYHTDEWGKISDRYFDNIVAMEVLEHVENLEEVISMLKHKISEDGRLIVTGPTENIFYKIGRKIAGFSGDYHVRDIYEIERALLASGFKIVHKVTIPYKLLFSAFVIYQFELI